VAYLFNLNLFSLFSYATSGNDTFNGSTGNDYLAAFDGNDVINGNAGDDILLGMEGNDSINGGTGADIMVGGLGNDTYVVDNTNDSIIEYLNEGTDLVRVAIATANGSYTLSDYLENGTLTNTVAFNLTGNGLNNTLTGNAAANILTSLGGDDILNGLGGADTLIGGVGNDTYLVDNVGDIVRELIADSGTDLVQSSVSYSLDTVNAAGVENLTLTGTVAINGTGNALANTITGNSGANVLNGGSGNDTLIGGAGNDTLTGGDGLDTFMFNTALNATSNKDTITDFLSGNDKIALENAIMTGLGLTTGQLSADQFRSGAGVSTANDSSDRVIYNTTTGALFYDADGLGGTAAIQIALMGTTIHPAITYQDIFIV
jgi:Ca2+-binding RTX toxin-like protein